MIIVLNHNVQKEQQDGLAAWLRQKGASVQILRSADRSMLYLTGGAAGVDADLIGSLEIVDRVERITDPFRKSNRKCHPGDTIVEVGGVRIGSGHFAVIAGPCCVETEEQIVTVAKAVKSFGADLLRGGAFKPRTSPYDFQGLGAEGIRLLEIAKAETGLPLVTECMGVDDLALFENVDMIQIGARNMQNYELLKAVAKLDKPVLLKRGRGNTIKELLLSAEYILAGGNEKVVLCERGERAFDEPLRNTLDLTAVCLLRELSHLPVIADPSHAAGMARFVPSMAMAAAACGCDGLMIEVHNDPKNALCDGAQALRPEAFGQLMERVRAIRDVVTEE